MNLKNLKVGDQVTRVLAGMVEMDLTITSISLEHIICDDWIFDISTGLEIDDVLNWDSNFSGSYIKLKT